MHLICIYIQHMENSEGIVGQQKNIAKSNTYRNFSHFSVSKKQRAGILWTLG